MIDFGKLYCDLHSNQLITNFCLNEQCMLGLCATCICTHTDSHMNNNTSPQYQNIRTTYSMMHQMIRNNISQIEQQKNRIDKLNQFIKIKRITIKNNVEQLRCDMITQINIFFQNKQKILLREMQAEQKRISLHSQIRLQSLLNTLNRQSANLLNSAQEINSLNFLQSYKRIKSQIITNCIKVKKQVSAQLDNNQNFQTIINISNDHVPKLIKVMDQSMGLSFHMNQRNQIYSYQKCQNQLLQVKTKQSNQYTSRFMNQNKFNHKINQNKINKSQFNISQEQQESAYILSNHHHHNNQNINNNNIINNNINNNNINNNNINNLRLNKQKELIRKQTDNFGQLKQNIHQSLNIQQDRRPLYKQISSRVQKNNDINKNQTKISTPIQSVCQSTIFKQKDINNMTENNNNKMINKNYQSQLIINNNNNNNNNNSNNYSNNNRNNYSNNNNKNKSNFVDNNNNYNEKSNIVKNATSTIIYQEQRKPIQYNHSNINHNIMLDTFNNNLNQTKSNNYSHFNNQMNSNSNCNSNIKSSFYCSKRTPNQSLSPELYKVVNFRQQPRPQSQPKQLLQQYRDNRLILPSNSVQQFYQNHKQINKININMNTLNYKNQRKNKHQPYNELNINNLNANQNVNNTNQSACLTMEGRKIKRTGLNMFKGNQYQM